MNNDELKNKMVKVLRELRASKPIVTNDYGLQIISCTTDREIADALIAAGFGDVKEAEHRAEVLERVLKDIAYQQENLTIKVNGRIWSKEEIYKQWIAQAEKELSEEGKDD